MSAYQDYPIIGDLADGSSDVHVTHRRVEQPAVKVFGAVAEAQRVLKEVDALRAAVLSKVQIRAELARRGLLGIQCQPYEDADTGRVIYPHQDPEMIETVWTFISWLAREAS